MPYAKPNPGFTTLGLNYPKTNLQRNCTLNDSSCSLQANPRFNRQFSKNSDSSYLSVSSNNTRASNSSLFCSPNLNLNSTASGEKSVNRSRNPSYCYGNSSAIQTTADSNTLGSGGFAFPNSTRHISTAAISHTRLNYNSMSSNYNSSNTSFEETLIEYNKRIQNNSLFTKLTENEVNYPGDEEMKILKTQEEKIFKLRNSYVSENSGMACQSKSAKNCPDMGSDTDKQEQIFGSLDSNNKPVITSCNENYLANSCTAGKNTQKINLSEQIRINKQEPRNSHNLIKVFKKQQPVCEIRTCVDSSNSGPTSLTIKSDGSGSETLPRVSLDDRQANLAVARRHTEFVDNSNFLNESVDLDDDIFEHRRKSLSAGQVRIEVVIYGFFYERQGSKQIKFMA